MYKPRDSRMGKLYESDKERTRLLTNCKLLSRASIPPVGIKLRAGYRSLSCMVEMRMETQDPIEN